MWERQSHGAAAPPRRHTTSPFPDTGAEKALRKWAAYARRQASPYAGNTNNAWNVNFSDGNANNNNKNNNNYVRCVRGGA